MPQNFHCEWRSWIGESFLAEQGAWCQFWIPVLMPTAANSQTVLSNLRCALRVSLFSEDDQWRQRLDTTIEAYSFTKNEVKVSWGERHGVPVLGWFLLVGMLFVFSLGQPKISLFPEVSRADAPYRWVRHGCLQYRNPTSRRCQIVPAVYHQHAR